jgi:F-type H+-transporting ATPase subunit epsilon
MAKSSTFSLEVVAPTGIIYQDEVSSVSVPTPNGIITIMPYHTALFTKLSEGQVDIDKDGKQNTIVVSGGFAEVKDNSVHILSDHAIRAESIEIAKSEERKRSAEEKLKTTLSNEEFTLIDKDLKLSILELKAAEKMRKKQRI